MKSIEIEKSCDRWRSQVAQDNHRLVVSLLRSAHEDNNHMIAQQALPFLFIFTLTSSDALVGTRREMCTVVRLSGAVANLHSVLIYNAFMKVSEKCKNVG